MEARAQDKKLTRPERLKKCEVPDDIIPDEFRDEGLTYDIMEKAGEVDGKKLDLSAVERWQREKVADAMTKSPPVAAEEMRLICLTNPFTRVPYKTYNFLKDLDQEIEAWLFSKEIEFAGRAKEEQKEEALQLIEANLKKANASLEILFDPAYELEINDKESETNTLLTKIDLLNKARKKLLLSNRYYDEPAVVQYEINRLLKKQETGDFTEEDKKELELCYSRLDKKNHGRPIIMRFFRPGILQILGPPENNDPTAIPLLSLPGFHGAGSEEY